MLKKIKQQLLENPTLLQTTLEHFGYCNVVIHGDNYLSCGRDADSSKKSIVVRLQNNDYLYVIDYPLNINKDIFSYICEQKSLTFPKVLNDIKEILGIDNYYSYYYDSSKSIFGGFYDKIKNKNQPYQVITYDENELNAYIQCPNKRFLRDHISLEVQNLFDIRYDVESQSIVIPIRDQVGNLMAIKMRANYELEEGDMKYWYALKGRASQTLYGYCQNYNFLVNSVVLIGEAEKFVLQCATYGYRNAVALGSGTISKAQVQMIMNLQPKSVILMHDQGYDMESIERNISMLKNYSRFSDIPVGYWDYTMSCYGSKVASTDMGKEIFENILENEIKWSDVIEELQDIS